MKLRDLEDVASLFVTHEMNNLTHLCGEYAAINGDGELVFEPEGERLCLVNTKVMMLRDGRASSTADDRELTRSGRPLHPQVHSRALK